ncbi:MAG: hypothetical protein M0P71_00740 [Melioribacteraceae bacterium]|nr:hypothetical protein [Melioribacteraceae bacterium]
MINIKKGYRVKIKTRESIDNNLLPTFVESMEDTAVRNKRILIVHSVEKNSYNSSFYRLIGRIKPEFVFLDDIDFIYSERMFDLTFTEKEQEAFKKIKQMCVKNKHSICNRCSYNSCKIIRFLYTEVKYV